MGRSTVYNNITSPELISQVLSSNISLMDDFLEYLQSVGRSVTTRFAYKNDLLIFWVWNLQNNNNKEFVKITKREFSRFQNHCINVWGWSSNRIRRVKSVISSMSNFIENILDEEPEFEGYRSTIKKIESPVKETVREKTVFEPEELQALLDYLVVQKKYMQACILALAMYSGRRKSELTRFKVNYFNEENVMFGSLYKTPEKVKTKGRGNGKYLELYVLKKDFDPYLKLWMERREELGIESEWLFPLKTSDGWSVDEHIKPETLDNWVDTYTKFLGKDFYWHSLRHYFTTQCFKANLPSSVIQEIVGWDSADMCNLYNDTSTDETLAQYFDENGIKDIKPLNISDM